MHTFKSKNFKKITWLDVFLTLLWGLAIFWKFRHCGPTF
jgi:hypothetical protein